jgi:hypothetical protein
MAIAPYDPGSLGPSQAAGADQLAYQNSIADAANRNDLMLNKGHLQHQFESISAPQLQSSLGATGQFYSTAGKKAEGEQQAEYTFQQHALDSAFNKAHMDMQRQQVFAAMGLIL